ncbi:sterol uptake control 2 [Trichoderma arundinaceum]|uniref:Sterol uptake control 2 n=1 Tax=Trichoderma arundinaceum TaxID=490622 RepID=A0A395NJ53_TRIAR|nr:sterol uptake control 2 [Trichoderma arundinaceum]
MQTLEPTSSGVQPGYRGRVRSGCLTCRSRKVKCDELRPVCHNCTRLKRRCVYKPRKSRQHQNQSPASEAPEQPTPDGCVSTCASGRPAEAEAASQQYPSPLSEGQDGVLTEGSPFDGDGNIAADAANNPFLSPDSSIVDITARLERALRRQDAISSTPNNAEFESISPSTLISRDIELTTTIDVLAIHEVPLQPSFSFFVERVDCPAITPYDGINWRRMKAEVVNIGASNEAVAEAIVALSTLYKGQMYGLPLSKAMCLYKSAKAAYEKLLDHDAQNFDAVLISTFLLSLFEIVQYYETVPLLREPSERFLHRLRAWAKYQLPHSSLAVKIISWMRLLHTTTIRGGGMGLLSDDVYNLFSSCSKVMPNLAAPSSQPPDTSTHIYEMLATPIFEFYFELQMISGEIAKMTHYHRSRTTGDDQKDVVEQMTHIISRLHALWDARSATQRQTPDDLRAHLAPKIADPVITLIGMCNAAYHAEFIEIGRVLGDPVSESAESRQAMRQIRDIIDGDWNAQQGGVLKSGYLRPLFLYAIECMDHDENQWAVRRLEKIKNPICRSDFFAAFGKELLAAQLRKERRVTSKFFCIWYFGVPPPFL